MQVSIYKSSKKDEMYLYVARPADEGETEETFEPLEVLSEPVRVAFGRA
ncbi:YcgL domain-containing protein, partial [Escherichia coli]